MRPRLWLAAGAIVVAAAALLLLRRPGPAQHAAADTPPWAGSLTARTPGSTSAAPLPRPAAAPRDEELEPAEGPEPGGAPAGAVPLHNPVDLAALRRALPDNLYWQLGAPTEDPEVLARRHDEEERMNELFGKVQSSTATEEEIHSYYDRRRQISEDYMAFASRVLEDYGKDLSEQDAGLYALSVKMHRAQLEEIPRKALDALARSQAHARLREEQRAQ